MKAMLDAGLEPEDSRRVWASWPIAHNLRLQKRRSEAETIDRQRLDRCLKTEMTGGAPCISGRRELASDLSEQGRWAEAAPLIRKTLSLVEERNDRQFLSDRADLATVLIVLGQAREADDLIDQTYAATGGAPRAVVSLVLYARAQHLEDQGQRAAADHLRARIHQRDPETARPRFGP
jgi:hypothetical protein